MSTVLLTTDGSDLASAAMVQGIEVLGHDHRFVSVAVVSDAYVPSTVISPMMPSPVVDPVLEADLDAEGEAAGHGDLLALDELLGLTTEQRVIVGDPGDVICTVAAEIGASVIVVGSHGHGWFQRVLVGSTSNHVVSHAPCPVLVVRLEPAESTPRP
jgi:nucleotide-binding universal stress UspA family protein